MRRRVEEDGRKEGRIRLQIIKFLYYTIKSRYHSSIHSFIALYVMCLYAGGGECGWLHLEQEVLPLCIRKEETI